MSLTSTYNNTTVKAQFEANSFGLVDQLSPTVLALSNGGFVVAYNNYDTSDGYIMVDFYDSGFNRIGTYQDKIPFNGDTTAIGQPTLTETSDGNVMVIWDENQPGEAGINGRIFDATGAIISPEFSLGVGASFEDPQVAALNGGHIAYTYTSNGNVYVYRTYPGGSEAQQVNTLATTGVQNDSAIAVLADGGYVVTYTDTNTADQQIRGAIFNADGSVRKADFPIGLTGDNTQSKVVALQNGNFAVVYTDSGWNENGALGNGISLQILDAQGNNVAPGAVLHVNAASAADEREPAISVLDNGMILVSWTRASAPGDADIYGRVYTQAGVAVTGEFAITQGGTDLDSKPSIAALNSGQYVTVWQDGYDMDGEGGDNNGGKISAEINEIVRTTTGDGADDVFDGDALRDVVSGLGGEDTLSGAGGDDTLAGGEDDDILNGGAGDDILNGGYGEDIMTGGLGNDLYLVHDAGDQVSEQAVYGVDEVGTFVSWTLGANFENLTLLTDADINGTGNSAANIMTGNVGDNALTGGGGDDILTGGAGADALNGGADSDTASYAGATAAVAASLANPSINAGEAAGDTYVSVENLVGSNFHDILNGSSGDNVIDGGKGYDTIKGYGGNDTLSGGAGKDNFVFNAALDGSTNVDTITDFNVAADTVQLDNAFFTALAATGALAASAFKDIAGGPKDASDRIIYNSDTGNLYYDADGSGDAFGNVKFATLANQADLTAADFVVI